jgi:putative transposase
MSARPPRLPETFQRYDLPLYFITCCTAQRRNLLANQAVLQAFLAYVQEGRRDHNAAVGRYVFMPDHVHLFVRGGPAFRLTWWMRGLKRVLGDALRRGGITGAIWQEGFFDHLMRSSESYAKKWEYVRENPVRKGLVPRAEDWPYAGELVIIDRV